MFAGVLLALWLAWSVAWPYALGVAALTVVAASVLSWGRSLFAPVVVELTRHRVRIDQNGRTHADVLIEELDEHKLFDLMLYVLQAGHGGPRAELLDLLSERLAATQEGEPLSPAIKQRLRQLSGQV